MNGARVKVALVTGGTVGGAHPRIAQWLRLGFERLGEPFDSVHVEGPAGVERIGSTRIVRLGTRRLRWAALPIARYLRSTQPTIALSTPVEVAVVTLAVGRSTGSRIVPWEQTMARVHVRDHARRLWTLPRLQRLTYGSAAAIAVTSADVGADLTNHLGDRVRPERVRILPNPIDADEIRALAVPAAGRTQRFRFCAVGRLTSQKGHDILLKAAAMAARRIHREWEIVVCGAGPLHQALERQASALGVADRVSFLGFLDNPYPVLASADVFVHPARWEGFGLVLAEALALGVPVIASACPGGPREILGEGEFGVLIAPEDPEALCEAMVRLSDDDEFRRQLAGRGPHRVAQYAPEAVASRAIAIAEKVEW